MAGQPLVYAIGLESLLARAVYADLAGAVIRRLGPLEAGAPRCRQGQKPDLVLLDLSTADVDVELAAVRDAWGEAVVVVGVSRSQPLARIWGPDGVELVELGPGFLSPFLG